MLVVLLKTLSVSIHHSSEAASRSDTMKKLRATTYWGITTFILKIAAAALFVIVIIWPQALSIVL